jgi:hypothetical protein
MTRSQGEGQLIRQIYEFGASAGSLEGYLYRKPDTAHVDMNALPVWVDNLAEAYQHLPPEAIKTFQEAIDQTLGRAVHSLMKLVGEDHPLVSKLRALTVGPLPSSADDFRIRKWFHK